MAKKQAQSPDEGGDESESSKGYGITFDASKFPAALQLKQEDMDLAQRIAKMLSVRTSFGIGYLGEEEAEERAKGVVAKAMCYDVERLLADPGLGNLLSYGQGLLNAPDPTDAPAKLEAISAAAGTIFSDPTAAPLSFTRDVDFGTLFSDPVVRSLLYVTKVRHTTGWTDAVTRFLDGPPGTPLAGGLEAYQTDEEIRFIPPPAMYYTVRSVMGNRVTHVMSATAKVGQAFTHVFERFGVPRPDYALHVGSVHRETVLTRAQEDFLRRVTNPTLKDVSLWASIDGLWLDPSVVVTPLSAGARNGILPSSVATAAPAPQALNPETETVLTAEEWDLVRTFFEGTKTGIARDISTFWGYSVALASAARAVLSKRDSSFPLSYTSFPSEYISPEFNNMVSAIAMGMKEAGVRVSDVSESSRGSHLNLLYAAEKEVYLDRDARRAFERMYDTFYICRLHELDSDGVAGILQLFRDDTNLFDAPRAEVMEVIRRLDPPWWQEQETIGNRRSVYRFLVESIGSRLEFFRHYIWDGTYPPFPENKAGESDPVDLFCFCLEMAYLLDDYQGKSLPIYKRPSIGHYIEGVREKGQKPKDGVADKFVPKSLYDGIAQPVDDLLGKPDYKTWSDHIQRGKSLTAYQKCIQNRDWKGLVYALVQVVKGAVRDSVAEPAQEQKGKKRSKKVPGEDLFLAALQTDPPIRRAVLAYYTVVLKLRHFFRTHCELVPGVPDFGIFPGAILVAEETKFAFSVNPTVPREVEVLSPTPAVLDAAWAQMQLSLGADAQVRGKGAALDGGGKVRVEMDADDLIPYAKCIELALDGSGEAALRPSPEENGNPRNGVPDRFPHPAVWWALKHVLNRLLANRMRNFGTMAARYSQAYRVSASLDYPTEVRGTAMGHVKSIDSAEADLNTLFGIFLRIFQGSFVDFAQFVFEGRTSPLAIQFARSSGELPKNLQNWILLENKLRSLRNRFDFAHGEDNPLKALNRKKLRPRFEQLERALGEFLTKLYKKSPIPDVPLAVARRVLRQACQSRVVVYFGNLTKLQEISRAFPAADWGAVSKVAGAIAGDGPARQAIDQLAAQYSGRGGTTLSPPLLGAVIKALATQVRAEVPLASVTAKSYLFLRRLDVKLTRLAYAFDWFEGQLGANQELPAECGTGFRFLLDCPAIIPDRFSSDALASQVSAVACHEGAVRDFETTAGSSGDTLFTEEKNRFDAAAQEGAEKDAVFSTGGTDFRDATALVLAVLVTIHVLGIKDDDIASFIKQVEQPPARRTFVVQLPPLPPGTTPDPSFALPRDTFGALSSYVSLKLPPKPRPKLKDRPTPLPTNLGTGSKFGFIGDLTYEVTPHLADPDSDGCIRFTLPGQMLKAEDAQSYNYSFNSAVLRAELDLNRDFAVDPQSRHLTKDVARLDRVLADLDGRLKTARAEASTAENAHYRLRWAEEEVGKLGDEPTAVALSEWLGTPAFHDPLVDQGVDADYYVRELKSEDADVSEILAEMKKALSREIKATGLYMRGRQRARKALERNQTRATAERAQAGLTQEQNSYTRGLINQALAFFRKDYDRPGSPLRRFVDQAYIPCLAKVPKALREKIHEGAKVSSFQILPPRNGRHIAANVHLEGPRDVMQAPPKWASVLQAEEPARAGGTMGMDDNQLECLRTFTFGIIDDEGHSVPLDVVSDDEMYNLPARHLAMLVDAAKFVKQPSGGFAVEFNKCWGNRSYARGEVTQPLHFCAWDPKSPSDPDETLLQRVNASARTFAKIRFGVISDESIDDEPVALALARGADADALDLGDFPLRCAAGHSLLRQPSDADPFEVEAEPRVPTLSDQIGAVTYYLASLRGHLSRHLPTIQKKTDSTRKRGSRLAKAEKDSPSPAGAAELGNHSGEARRLLAEFNYLNDRLGSLRECLGDRLLRVVTYMWARYRPAKFAFERLKFSPVGRSKGLAQVINAMFTNVVRFLGWASSYVGKDATPAYRSVKAQNTSKYCFNCGGEVDRRTSNDFGYCARCGRVVDSHVNAAWNIALHHPADANVALLEAWNQRRGRGAVT